MNTIANVVGMVAALGASLYLFGALTGTSGSIIAFSMLGVAMVMLVWAVQGLAEDFVAVKGKRDDE
jgi:hypothetical protein